jgi:Lon protease-like protein
MPMYERDERRLEMALSQFWNTLTTGEPADASDVDPDLAATIRYLHQAGSQPNADPAFFAQLGERLTGAPLPVEIHPNGSISGTLRTLPPATRPAKGEPSGITSKLRHLRRISPLLPLRGTVVFPLPVVHLAVVQPRSLRLIDEAMSGDRTVALVMQKDAEQEGAGPNDVYEIGTIATIHQMMRGADGSVRLAVQGIERMRILEFISEEPFLVARVEKAPEEDADSVEIQALTRNTLDLYQRLVSLVSHLPYELVTAALNIDDPCHLCYLVATNLRMEPEERQRLLELDSVLEKLTSLNAFISKELDE